MNKLLLAASLVISTNAFAQFSTTDSNAEFGKNQVVTLEKTNKFSLSGEGIKVGDYMPSIQLVTSELKPFDTSSKNKSVKITGEGPLPEQVVGVDLHAGWNLIGNPFDQSLDASQIYISTSGTRYSIRDLSQSETEHSIWFIDITKPRYVPLEKLEPFQGAWLYVNNPNGIEVIYFRGTEDPNYPIDFEPLPRSKGEAPKESSRRLASLLPPGRPGSFTGGSVSAVTPVASSSGGSGGGGGCLCR